MIKLTKDSKEYEFRNLADEVTLKEFDRISQIMNPKKEGGDEAKLEKWLKVVEVLGCRELAEVIDTDSFLGLIKNFKATDVNGDIKEVIEINKNEYKLSFENDKLSIPAKDSALIENYFRTKTNWISYAVAVLYKDVNLSNKEHYDKSHISHKVDVFSKDMTADICAPLVFELNKQLAESYKKIAELNAKA